MTAGPLRLIVRALTICVVTAQAIALAQTPANTMSVSDVRALGQSSPGAHATVRGVVTRQRPGVSLFITDASGSLYINTDQGDDVSVGDLVEVTGRAANDGFSPFLDRATYRKVGTGTPVAPKDVQARDLASGSYEAQLVRLDATVVEARFGRYENGVLLRADGAELLAWVRRETADQTLAPVPGARLRVTGVCSMNVTNRRATGFELLLRDAGDVVVLDAGPWWTMSRLLLLLEAIGIALALMLLWIAVLLRRVRKQVRERARLEEGLRQAQKIEAVGQLAGGIAHDFNNLLTVVMGYSDVIAVEARGDQGIQSAVDEIRRAADRAAMLTRQLLAFGRRQVLATTFVDLNETVLQMARLLARVLGGEIELVTRLHDGPVRVMVDSTQMEQAILNLAVNARDAMESTGRLTMSTLRRTVERSDGDVMRGEYAVLVIADTGAGMTDEIRQHIFEPFFTTKDVGEGSGLGLPMVYGFVKQSGGYMHVHSAPGKGTTFELAFPISSAS